MREGEHGRARGREMWEWGDRESGGDKARKIERKDGQKGGE